MFLSGLVPPQFARPWVEQGFDGDQLLPARIISCLRRYLENLSQFVPLGVRG
jgi:hypothetical protein